MDGTFNAGLKAGTEVVVATCRCCLGAYCLQKAFGPQAAVHLANTNRAGAWLLVESDHLRMLRVLHPCADSTIWNNFVTCWYTVLYHFF